jgi:hypothetical protein
MPIVYNLYQEGYSKSFLDIIICSAALKVEQRSTDFIDPKIQTFLYEKSAN